MIRSAGSGKEDAADDELFGLFEACAKVLAGSGDAPRFLDWIARAGPDLAPAFARGIDPRAGPPGHAFRAMGIAIYNATPLAEAGFQTRRLALPGRNEPCLCGSGRKYKHCCLALEGTLDLSDYNMLRHVLDSVPKRRFAALPASRVDPFAVCDTARQWQEEGDEVRAAALLEPWFAGDAPLADRLEPLFEQLMDCYLALGQEGKRTRLLAAAIARGARGLRSAALQRQSTVLADRGDLEAAWQSFRDAQREDPEDPNLATLELTLLVSRGEIEQARERAHFWISRLERRRDPELRDFIGFLRKAHADPLAAMAEGDLKGNPGLERFADLLAAAPGPQAHYALAERGEAGSVLEPGAALAATESRWRKVFPQTKPGLSATQHDSDEMWDAPAPWLDLLGRDALAWQSFDVLDDLAMAVEVLQPLGAGATILDPLLERGAALLELHLATAAQGSTLQWGWPANRPALRMLAHRAHRAAAEMDRDASAERFVDAAERLLALNPDDNQFVREPLTRAYLARGQPEKVVALTDRFADDLCGPTLNRILALLRLARRSEALTALRDAAQDHRVAIEMLLADAPRQPRSGRGPGITVGGKEEAWEYRAAQRALWQRDGSLDWLRAAWGEVRKGLRPGSGR